jgi:hypothetical protein
VLVHEHAAETFGVDWSAMALAQARARRVLRPGGVLLLSTPNLAAWFNRSLVLLGVQPVFSEVSLRRVYGRPGREVAGHLRLFTRGPWWSS